MRMQLYDPCTPSCMGLCGVLDLDCQSEKLVADLRGAVDLSHHFLRTVVKPGDRALDATCGNGHDTLFLAKLVGEGGMVLGMDIQECAVMKTSALLEENGLRSRVKLVAAGHEMLSSYLTEGIRGAVFNLGFLPGGDRELITRPDTTVAALDQSVALLLPGGMLVVSLYSGHPGGGRESAAVEGWSGTLDPAFFNVWCHRQMNRSPAAPYLIVVERRR